MEAEVVGQVAKEAVQPNYLQKVGALNASLQVEGKIAQLCQCFHWLAGRYFVRR